jgi:AraC-like DNA-binding protein
LYERDSDNPAMLYAEHVLPPPLGLLAPSVWTLAPGAESPAWIDHEATPDGCIEIIRRHSGRSAWRQAQPELFATGLSAAPIRFGFSGDASFTAVKLWPWAWEALGGVPCPSFADGWIPLDEGHPLAPLLAGDAARVAQSIADAIRFIVPPPIAGPILTASSVEALQRTSGLAPRRLQRWFAVHIGMAPRSYLRVIRFRGSLRALPGTLNLADHAAAHGYADQAHMARDFRALAGAAPSDARRRARGPFL